MTKRTLKSHSQWQTTKSGFTLIEVMIALFIGSLIFGVLYASFFQIMKSKEIAESELELYHEARVIIAKIAQDLNSAYPRGNLYLAESNYVSKQLYFESKMENENSWLKFTSLSRAPNYNRPDSDQAQITYYVLELDKELKENSEFADSETKLYSLYRSETPYMGGDDNGVAYSLSDRVVLFRLNYLNGQDIDIDESYVDAWNSNENTGFPRAVDIYLVLRGPDQRDVEFRNLIYLQMSKQ